MPLVSILLPTHNRADTLALAIASIRQQTVEDFELLVVADGCTDATADHVRGLGDSRIRLFDLPKAPGFGYANRNVVLRDARGEFVAYAAHDDLWFPDHLELMLAPLASAAIEWVYSRPLWVSTDGVIVPFGVNLTLRDELEWFLTRANSIPASCVAHRRFCLERDGYWPEDVPNAADWRLWIAIIEGGGHDRLAFVPVPTCLHFSANWRASRHAQMSAVAELLAIADEALWWPSALRSRVEPGTLEQQTLWTTMQADPEWPARVRQATRTVLDRIAWDAVRVVRPEGHARTAELTREREAAVAAAEGSARERDAAIAVAEAAAAAGAHSLAAEHASAGALRAALAAVEEGRLALQHASDQIARLEDEGRLALQDASDRIARLEHELGVVAQSKSWRWTAGLRRLRGLAPW